MILWPRMVLQRAKYIFSSEIHVDDCEILQGRNSQREKEFAPVGGRPIANSELSRLRVAIEEIAADHDYPAPIHPGARSVFDAKVQQLFVDISLGRQNGIPRLPLGEAIRPEVWAWCTTILVPHIIKWRWSDAVEKDRDERFTGAIYRNALGRLWYYAHQLGCSDGTEDWKGLLEPLGEDQKVGLFERSSLGANPDICRAVARVWRDISAQNRSERLFREAMKALIVRGAIQRLDSLNEGTLVQIVREVFAETSKRLDGPVLFS